MGPFDPKPTQTVLQPGDLDSPEVIAAKVDDAVIAEVVEQMINEVER